jgi:HD-like signal output (HDOD) protein
MATRLPDPFQMVLQAGAGNEHPFHHIEEATLGVSHAEIGAYLLGLWGLPAPVVQAVAHHHHPARSDESETFGVLGANHVADLLAHEMDHSGEQLTELDESYLQSLGVWKHLPEWRAIAAYESARRPE